MTRITWRHQYDEADERHHGEECILHCLDETKTQRHFKDEADLNTILARMGVTDGAIPPMAPDPRYYGDFSDAGDFRSILDQARHAAEMFNALPATIRERFQNDPARLLDFVHDERNHEEAVTMGLLKKQVAPEAPPAPPTPPTT